MCIYMPNEINLKTSYIMKITGSINFLFQFMNCTPFIITSIITSIEKFYNISMM